LPPNDVSRPRQKVRELATRRPIAAATVAWHSQSSLLGTNCQESARRASDRRREPRDIVTGRLAIVQPLDRRFDVVERIEHLSTLQTGSNAELRENAEEIDLNAKSPGGVAAAG
jgi:hypothetical protein